MKSPIRKTEAIVKHSHTRIAMTIASLVAVGTLGTISAWAGPNESKTVVSVSVHAGKSDTLTGVAFTTSRDGWLIGNHVILHTTNGGKGFSQQYRGTANLQHIEAIDSNHAFAWGYHHLVGTTNAGLKWTEVPIPGLSPSGHAQILNAYFASSTIGTVLIGQMDQPSGLYLTTDGGSHWTKLAFPPNAVSVAMTSAKNGWLITTSSNKLGGGFYHTTDGGHTWTRTQGEAQEAWYINGANIYPTGGNSAYAQIIGQAGMTQSSYSVFRTTNGLSWTPVIGVSTAGGGPAPGVNSNQHVPVGPGIDAGPMSVVGKNQLRIIGGTEATGIGVVQMAASNDGGQHWQSYPTIPGANGYPFASSMLSFVNGNDGWLLETRGSSQDLLQTTNGGKSWREEYPESPMWPVMGVSYINPKLAYGLGIVGDVNKIVRSTDGGKTWSAVGDLPVRHDAPYVGPVSAPIDFVNAKVGVAVGGNGNLYLTKDGAKSWRESTTPSKAGRVFGVVATDGAARMVIDTQNGIYKSITSGKTWTPVKSTGSSSMGGSFAQAVNQIEGDALKNGLAELGPNPGISFAGRKGPVEWLSGNNGYDYLVSVDGGRNFTKFQLPTNIILMLGNLGFTSQSDGYMWTLGGRLFTTTDGGKTWTQVTNG